jgi:membrane associated rhomboid family serine protease
MPIRLTKAVKAILILCFAAFVIQHAVDQFFGGNLLGWFALVPAQFILNHRFWQLFTYAFLHADVMHLFFNLMMLAFIGGEIEALWGTRRFLQYYFFCAVSAGVLYLVLQAFVWGGEALYVPMVGASGAIYGLLMAYGLIFGERTLLFMLLFPMKAKYFVWILAGIEFMSTVFSGRGGLSSAAHLGGMAAGFIYLWTKASYQIAKRRKSDPTLARAKKKKKNHLKLITNNPRGKGGAGPDDSGEPPKTWH